jgi:hypothetical protein
MPRWIVRRVESIEFLDDTNVRRRVSIDFALPRQVTPIRLGIRNRTTFVPLTYFEKGPMRNFDLRDESGAALPLLTKTENGELSAAALAYLGERALGQSLEDEVLSDLTDLTYASGDAASSLLERLFRQEGAARPTRFRLAQDAAFAGQAQRLAEAFLLIVPLRNSAGRRVIKFAFDEPLVRTRHGRPQRFAESLSWRPTRITVDVPGVPLSGSYHLEAQAPAELTLTHSELVLRDRPILLDEDSGPRPRVHLMTGTHLEGARAILRLMAPKTGIIRTSFLTALFTAVVLTAGAFRLSALVDAKDGVATVLVGVPAVIAVYIARPGEHALASRLLFGVRACVLLSGIVSFAASALLLAGPGGVALEAAWWSLDGVAILMAVLLLASLMRSRKPPKTPYRPPRVLRSYK